MKVNLDITVPVTDEERVRLANVLDSKESKRQATRQEFKDYIWENGSSWQVTLRDEWINLFGDEPETAEYGEGQDLDLDDLL